MYTITNIWIYDCEVFAHDWIIIAHRVETKDRHVFHNDNYAVASWIDAEKPILGGYNIKHYDQWILKAIYNGADNATVKALNDFIISGNEGWNYAWLSRKPMPWTGFDLMDDIPVALRLKEIEGNLGMSIEESSIPFTLERPLTPEELDEVIRYCHHDVDATERLYHERRDYLQSKINVGAMKGLSAANSMRLTNAKLTAEYLGAMFYDREDATEYEFPDNLHIDTYLDVREFFTRVDPTYKRKLVRDIAGVKHTIAWGGLHGALECYGESSTETRTVMHIDVTSYYPSLMIVNGYLSRSAPDPGEYARVYEERIAAKKSGDKATANALKLVLNTTYGAMKNQYNKLYDPRMANAVCISGQLYLIDLIENLEIIPKFKLIQSNTDGLIVSYDAGRENEIRRTIAEWENRTGFVMGLDKIERIIQKDVNNYVMRDGKGNIEVKGGYVSNYDGGDFINRSLVIVAKAVVEYLLNDMPVEETINACAEPLQFQMITKAGSTYDRVIWEHDGEITDVQNVNRVYASRHAEHGRLYKIKIVGGAERREKIANTPEHCYIDNTNECAMADIDVRFYIDLAKKRIDDYMGVVPEKPKKERKTKKMTPRTSKAALETPEVQESGMPTAPLSLYRKLFQLQTAMDGYGWTKDGKNRHQSYEYITEKQYKTNFKRARAAAGLLWKMEEVGRDYVGAISDKMHLILAQFRGRLIDPDTGEYEEYTFSGSGADNGDKALYKAYTGGLKFFLASNYLVAEDNDPENDDAEVRAEKPKYVAPERREEIRDALSNQNGPATDEQLETIAIGIDMMRDEGVDAQAIAEINAMLEGELTKDEAEQILETISELLESVG